MRQGRFTLDFGLQAGIDGYTDGGTWNGWAVPYFTHENASKIVAMLTSEYATGEYLAPPDGTGGYDEERDSFYFYDIDDSQYTYEEVLFGAGFTTTDGLKLYPFGSGAWCWLEVGVHFTENA